MKMFFPPRKIEKQALEVLMYFDSFLPSKLNK